jgi:MFS family permease
MDTTVSESRRASMFSGMAAALQAPVFRRIWSASLLSNLGIMIGGVGASWAMTQMTTTPAVVALVQTAQMAPSMFIALPAGAIADMFDRRKVGVFALSISLTGATILATLASLHMINPASLLALIFIIGSGMALFGPAWAASVPQQVPPEVLPQAIAMSGISYNLARSFGPAVGGLVVAAVGATAAFGANAVCYLPIMIVLFLWRPEKETSRLPPERFGRAVVSGLRYVANSPPLRILLTRTFLAGMTTASVSALMPLIARDLLHGDARLYGIMLGSYGLGAVVGGMSLDKVRARLGDGRAIQMCNIALGVTLALIGLSRTPFITLPALMVAGACATTCFVTLNIGVQLSSPRWVSARSVSAYQTCISGGMAVGGLIWGQVATHFNLGAAVLLSGGVTLASLLLDRLLPVPSTDNLRIETFETLNDPEVNLALTGRSGPIVMIAEYRVALDDARAFYRAMQNVQLSRQRNGAYGWSLSRDITEPTLWTERFECPTWHDFLRLRDRPTAEDREIQNIARTFHTGDEPIRVRRMLERPFGSVRWKEDVIDPALPDPPMGTTGSSG